MKWKRTCTIFLICGAMLGSGCGLIQEEEAYHVMQVEDSEEEETIGTAIVMRGDLTLENDVLASCQAEEKSNLSFAVSGEKYDVINAREGDHVKKGQLLAQLDCKD